MVAVVVPVKVGTQRILSEVEEVVSKIEEAVTKSLEPVSVKVVMAADLCLNLHMLMNVSGVMTKA